jgi:hypothetical protein
LTAATLTRRQKREWSLTEHYRCCLFFAATLARLGRADEARSAAEEEQAIDPYFTVQRFPPRRGKRQSDVPGPPGGRDREHTGGRRPRPMARSSVDLVGPKMEGSGEFWLLWH